MSDHLRDRLHQEMSGQLPPPDHDLVAGAVASALRARRVRRTASGAGTLAVVGLTVLAVTLGSQLGTGPTSSSVAAQAGGGVTAESTSQVAAAPVTTQAVAPAPVASAVAASPTTAVAATEDDKLAMAQDWHARQKAASAATPPAWTAAPAGVAATQKGELQLFSELAKPYGNASDFAAFEDDTDGRHVAAHLTRTDGKVGGVDFFLEHDTLGYAGDCAQPAPNDITCHPTKDGGYAIVADDGAGCVNTADLVYVHPDGTAVQVFLASCVKAADGTLIPGAQPLTAAQAEAIFTDHRFDFTMPADVLDRAAKNIGTLASH
jgi:hypothetical protein